MRKIRGNREEVKDTPGLGYYLVEYTCIASVRTWDPSLKIAEKKGWK